MKRIVALFLLMFLLLPLFQSCSVRFTFNGASIPENVKTASVQYFENRAPLINPVLSQTFTEGLKDQIINGSRLTMNDGTGDVDFSGEITGYDIQPMAIQSDAVSALTRLSIRVSVRCQNFKDPKSSWESTFSAYRDFASEKNITSVESELVSEMIEELAENIFNKAFADW
jgi:hypothetical protein